MAINEIESPSNRSQGLIMHTVHKGKNDPWLVHYLNLSESEIPEIDQEFKFFGLNFSKNFLGRKAIEIGGREYFLP